MDERFKDYSTIWTQAVAVGSRATCNPPPKNTDEDWLILCPEDRWERLKRKLASEGWALDGSEVSDELNDLCHSERFNSFSKDIDEQRVNLIATRSEEFFDRFWAATTIAKHLNLMIKQDRIDLFQAVLYGNARDDMPEQPAVLEPYAA
jgi:hypothetical protein